MPIQNDDICDNYDLIEEKIIYLYKKLSKKLIQHGITDVSNKSFTELIEQLDNIYAVNHYYRENIKPTDEPTLPAPQYVSYGDYNIRLAQKINYYMRLLGYYLALKGVNLTDINNARTLIERIDLIDSMDLVSVALLTVLTEDEYSYGELIEAPYILQDIDGNPITTGNITIKYENNIEVPYTIENGKLLFYPHALGRHSYYFRYDGGDKYIASQMIRTINVTPARIRLNTGLINTTNGRYYNSTDTGYNTDQWHITIQSKNMYGRIMPDVPIKILCNNTVILDNISTDENGNYDTYITIPSYGDNVIKIQTDYGENDNSYTHNVKIYHDLFCQQTQKIIKYGEQINYNFSTTLCNESNGNSPYTGYDNKIAYLYFDDVFIGNTVISNGVINYVIDDLPIGLHNFNIKMVLETDAQFVDIPEELYEDIGYESGDDILYPEGVPFIKTVIFEIRENRDMYNSAQINNNRDLILSTVSTVEIYENPSYLNTVFSSIGFDSNKNLVFTTVAIGDTIEDSLKDGITIVNLNENGDIVYQTINDIYSLDN